MEKIIKTIWISIVFLAFTVGAAYSVGYLFEGDSGNVALIKVKGEISYSESIFSEAVSSDSIIGYIKEANNNPEVLALLVEINSPGGAVVATKEIVTALKSVEKFKVCWLRDTAASGAYWIASACDVIVADEFTITGSIGVTGSYLEFSEFFENYGINYVRLVSGENKDSGSPYKEPSKAELEGIQQIINEMHNAFVSDVALNRNLSFDDVSRIADGSIFTGRYAKELGLVDLLGSKEEALQAIKENTNLTEIKLLEYEKAVGFSELMSGFLFKQMLDTMVSGNIDIKVTR